ncbi:hypothetical protein RclHR1_03450013 [Rhizophagus clarus]|uniref:F-box domain-containing protein n=1 Tax=Rhizophagus clarus TaxID=94130 RepID=A0A2Z6S552_9GLOM|nr:hypothetical protein RclHR1_03450013 [Rhizophagus clarus]GES74337.1 hypothetical protein GLOIN_2v1810914 [Rhizophagus clarus]
MEKLNVDCLVLIFNILRVNKRSLYSCLLINREWCRLVVPTLWDNYPYFFKCEKSREKLSNIILSHLSPSSKQLLFDNNIILPQTILSKPLTFNYISFYKTLDKRIIDYIVYFVLNEKTKINYYDNCYNYSKERNLLEQEVYKLLISQCKSIKILEWESSQPLLSFSGAQTCFSRLYNLTVDLNFVSSDDLYEIAQICKYLNRLYVKNISQDILGLTLLIEAQKNLKDVSFNFNSVDKKKMICEELSKALARKGCAIDSLSLFNSVGYIPYPFLISLVNLKRLHIRCYDCDNEDVDKDIKELKQYLTTSKFPHPNFLSFNKLSCFKELALLIERTNGNIIHLNVDTSDKSAENTGMLIKAIADNCPKIKYLTTCLGPKDLIYVKPLLLNCNDLIFLKFRSLNRNYDIGDELLDILTKFSPKSLTMITLSEDWKYSVDAFESFFESYRGQEESLYFNLLGIHLDYITMEHIKIIRKYFDEGIIKNSNVLF